MARLSETETWQARLGLAMPELIIERLFSYVNREKVEIGIRSS